MALPIDPLTTHKEGVALRSEGIEWSYPQLHTQVARLCTALQQRGISQGMRIGFVAHSSIDTVLLFFALWRLGAIACPLSPRLPAVQKQDALTRLGCIQEVFFPFSYEGLDPSFAPVLDPHLLATILLTSGSSGAPKMVCHTFSNHYYSALGTLTRLNITPASQYLLSLPLYHVSGIAIMMRTFLAGATLCLYRMPALEALFCYPLSHVSLVPTHLYRLLAKHPLPPPRSCRALLLGGAPVPAALLNLAHAWGWPLHVSYGMTETSSAVTIKKVLPWREVKIDRSEIYVRGPVVSVGYWSALEQRVIAHNHDWFATKDLGWFDEKGELYITGRKDRQFISGGENIQPEEIESALCSLPGVMAARVTPQADPEWGHRPFAQIDTLQPYTLAQIQEALDTSLPRFKHPVGICVATLSDKLSRS